jgi:hypothetical protein
MFMEPAVLVLLTRRGVLRFVEKGGKYVGWLDSDNSRRREQKIAFTVLPKKLIAN